MKVLSLYILVSVLFSGIVFAEESMQIDRSTRIMPDSDTYEAILREVDRDDRMDRCISRMQRDFADTPNRDFESACKRIFDNIDQQESVSERLRSQFRLTSDQAEKLAMIRAENRQRIEQMSQERLERLANLDIPNLERIASVNQQRLELLASLEQNQLDRFSKFSRSAMREYQDVDFEELKSVLAKAREKTVSPDDAGNRRTLSDAAKREARNRYQEAKNQFEQARGRYQEERREFSSLIAEEKRICQTGTDDECQDAIKESVDQAKDYLQELGEQQLSYLEQLRQRVQGSDSFTNSEVEDITEEIDEHVARINRALEYLSTAQTKSEVKEAGKSLTSAIKRIQVKVMDRREELLYREGKKFVSRAQALENKLDRMFTSLQEQGYDVSVYDEEVEEFSSLISQANDKLDEGRNYFEEFRSSQNPSENLALLSSAKESFSQAHERLVEANNLFSELRETIWEDTQREFAEEEEEVEVLIVDDPSLIDPPSLEKIEVTQ